jgi:hypothetical protein
MDYPGSYTHPGYSAQYGDAASGDVPYMVNQQPTDNTADVASAINGLSIGWGADEPQDYTRVLYEVMSLHWNITHKKIVIVFGDAPTHDLNFAGYNFGGDPGRDAVAGTADDLDFETVVGQVKDEGITVLAVVVLIAATALVLAKKHKPKPSAETTVFESKETTIRARL